MRVPRHTHLSFIRSIRSDFRWDKSQPVAEPAPVVHEAPVDPVIVPEVAPVIVAAPVEEPAAVEEAPVSVEEPVAPVKKTRKRKTAPEPE